MKAVCWNAKEDVRVERVNDPSILNPRDAIIRVTRTAICGSDLHLYDGMIPTMEPGDILGHEFMGEVVEIGHEVHNAGVPAHHVRVAEQPGARHAVKLLGKPRIRIR